jgi:hypothetical protein
VEKKLAIPFHSKDGRVDEVESLTSERADGVFDAMDGELVGCGVADDASLADVLATGLELGLDEDHGFTLPLGFRRCEGGDDRGKDEGRGDEADVHGEEGDGLGSRGGSDCRSLRFGLRPTVERTSLCECVELAGGQEAGVGAFEEGDAGVGAELVVDLAVAGVNCEDGGGAGLEHAVGEASGGGSDIRAGEAFDADGPGVEGGFQLEASAGDVAGVVAEETDNGGVGDGGSGFVDALLIDEDAAGDDHGLGSFAGFGEGAVNEELVET